MAREISSGSKQVSCVYYVREIRLAVAGCEYGFISMYLCVRVIFKWTLLYAAF